MLEISESKDTRIVKMSHGKVNAMDAEFCVELTKMLVELAGDSSAKAVVLTSAKRAFSAGVDLRRLIEDDTVYTVHFLDRLIDVFETLFQFPKPLVACINGPAVAGGCIMASASDYRLIVPRAKIGIPELRIGVPLPSIAIEIMRFVTAPQRFQDLVNIGSTYAGQNAVDVGLADVVVDRETALKEALEKASQLATIPPEVFAITKRQLRGAAIAAANANSAKFKSRLVAMWTGNEIRAVIRRYVEDRLSR